MFIKDLLNSVIFSLLEVENTAAIITMISGIGIKVINEIF
tara:strand:+ start:656 stop:775 length:120 start_codon:yes stop_codon:yes gene_type:complete